MLCRLWRLSSQRGWAQTLLTAVNDDDFAWAGVLGGEIGLLPDVETDIPEPADAAPRRCSWGPALG
jgi:hypothetical protein